MTETLELVKLDEEAILGKPAHKTCQVSSSYRMLFGICGASREYAERLNVNDPGVHKCSECLEVDYSSSPCKSCGAMCYAREL